MKTLQDYRQKIDRLDDQIIALIQQRFEIVKKVGHFKTQNTLDIVQTDRVQEVLDRVKLLAVDHELDPNFIASLYQVMIDHAHVLESEIKALEDDKRNHARG